MINDEHNSKILGMGALNIQQKIFVEKVKTLYQNLLLAIVTNLVCATIVIIALYKDNQNNMLWIWYLAVLMFSLFRFILYFLYKFSNGKKTFYYGLYIFGVLLSGGLWGVFSLTLMPTDNLLNQMVVIVIIAGVTSGSIQSLQVSFISGILYVLLTIFPLCIWLFFHNDIHYLALAIAMVAYMFFTIIISFRGHELLEKTLWLTFENDQLIEDLSLANTQLVSLNEQSSLMVSDLQQRELDAKIIYKMSELLQACKSSNEAYLIIGNSAKTLFQHLSGGLVIFDKSTQQLETMIQWGSRKILKKNFSMDDCWAVRQGHVYRVDDPGNSRVCNHFETIPVGGYLCIPQMNKEGVLGMFFLNAPKKTAITRTQQQLAITLNEVIKLSLSNIYLHELLNEQSLHDTLTHLYNRRFLDEILPRELLRVHREKQSLCVSMIDIDYFKQFNDVYGHEAGDEVLRYIGQVLNEHFRGSDIAARFGGEEFILVSVHSDINTIFPRLESLREEIKAHQLQFREQQLPPITISVGVAEAPRQGANMVSIIRAADEAMYLAKNNGKDQVVVFGSSEKEKDKRK